jgi:sugar lactone lactonase YvrE
VNHTFFTTAGLWSSQRFVAVASIALLVACGGGNSDPIASRDGAAQRSAIFAAPPPPPPPSNFPLDLLAGEAHAIGNLDGPALAARFRQPGGAVSDAQGNLYVADTNNHSIRKLTASGIVSTIAGGKGQPGDAWGPSASSRIANPVGIVRDRRGNLYVADAGAHAIRRLAPDGAGGWVVDTIAGKSFEAGAVDGTVREARFDRPWGLALDSLGNLYVADTNNHAVRRIRLDAGMVETFAGKLGERGDAPLAPGVPRLDTRFDTPSGVAVDAQGNVFVADTYNSVVQKISAQTQTAITVAGRSDEPFDVDGEGYPGAGNARLAYPGAIAIDSANRVLVESGTAVRALAFDGSATQVTTVAGSPYVAGDTDGPATSASFRSMLALHVTHDHDIIVMEWSQGTLRKISSGANPTVTTIAGARAIRGNTDGLGAAAKFDDPRGVAWSASTGLVVADITRIRAVDANGRVRTVAGSQSGFEDGPVATARFGYAVGVAVAPDGVIHVADASNCAVRRIASSQVSVIAGKPGDCQVIDGPPSVARFRGPRHLADDPGGLLVVEDHVLRRIHADGSIQTIAGSIGQCGLVDGDALTVGRLCGPSQVAVAPDGVIYVLDAKGIRRLERGADGRLNIATAFRSSSIRSFTIDPQGLLYVGSHDHTISRIAGNGEATLVAGTADTQSFIPGSLPGVLSEPNGMAIRPDGALLFSTGRGIGIARPGTYLPCTPSTC